MEPVSYLLTVYNKAPYLQEVLKAVEVERQRTGGEIIIVDDGSTDASAALIDIFAQTNPNVKVHHKENGGVASATNLAFSLTSCSLVRLVDGDDIIVPDSTFHLWQAMEEMGVGFAFGQYGHYVPGKERVQSLKKSEALAERLADPLWLMLRAQLPIQSASLAKYRILKSCFPLSEAYRASQDYALGLRLAQKTPFAQINAVTALLPQKNESSLSSSKAVMYAASTQMLADELQRHPHWPAGHIQFAVRRAAARARNYARRHLTLPLWQRVWVEGVRLVSYLPFASFSPDTFRRIAAIYNEALQDPQNYP